MSYIYYNHNPLKRTTTDCVIRACSVATDNSWSSTHRDICDLARMMGLMPDSGAAFGTYLRARGFRRHIIPNECPDCYTVKDFARDHPHGSYVVAIDGNPGHVVAVIDGDYIDIWDSGDEIPTYYYGLEDGHV